MMIERLRTDIRRTELILNSNSAYLYAQGSIIWAIEQLNADWKQQQPNKPVDKTPIQSAISKQNGYTIFSVIYDAQSYFNMNNLTDTQYQIHFARLIQMVQPKINAAAAQNITKSIMDWIAVGTNPALAEYYLKLTPSYQAPHRLMVSPSELRLVKDIDAGLFSSLSPYIIALPKTTQININNASPVILMSLSPKMSFDSAKAIAAKSQQAPFASTQDFLNYDIVKNNPIDGAKITVTSNYFLVMTNVTLGQQSLIIYTLLERTTQDKNSKTVVLWQSRGTL